MWAGIGRAARTGARRGEPGAQRACHGTAGERARGAGTLAPQSRLFVRQFRHWKSEPARSCGGHPGGREPRHFVQPTLRLRRGRPRQDPPRTGDRQPGRRPQPASAHPLHPRRAVCDRCGARLPAKVLDEFKRYYHSLDLLLIDDIQFFSNKGRTQEEFFYAFNALVEAHKQIVITCDTYPKEIAGMEERLISRFGWGLTVAIEPPELEMRVAIVLKKAEADAIDVSEEMAFFIAKHIRSNIRQLEAALKKVLAIARFPRR